MFENLRADLDRLHRYGCTNSGRLLRYIVMDQGMWAIICYRAGRHLHLHPLPPGLQQLARFFYLIWQKGIEVMAGISLPPECEIGPGLYIGHFGGLIVHPEVRIGRDCNLSHGVTLGVAGTGERRGVPTLGDRVYIAAGAAVIGKVHVASGTVVGAHAVLTRDTDENAVVVGIPARVISHDGSAEYIC